MVNYLNEAGTDTTARAGIYLIARTDTREKAEIGLITRMKL